MTEADEYLDCKGMNCPQPMVETRKKIIKMQEGETLEVVGDHGPSREEVPMAMEEGGNEILDVFDDDEGNWHVLIKKQG